MMREMRYSKNTELHGVNKRLTAYILWLTVVKVIAPKGHIIIKTPVSSIDNQTKGISHAKCATK